MYQPKGWWTSTVRSTTVCDRMRTAAFERLRGTRLPEGTFAIDPEEDRCFVALTGGAPADGRPAHPAWLFVATQRGTAANLAALLELVGARPEDGPLVGECEIELARTLRTGHAYRVTGEILDVERKAGRSGVFDLLHVRYELHDDAGLAAAYLNVIVVPRRGRS